MQFEGILAVISFLHAFGCGTTEHVSRLGTTTTVAEGRPYRWVWCHFAQRRIGIMTKALSLYLDALRFGAAFTVFVSHYSVKRLSGSIFWQMQPNGRTAVLVFFVPSGFVIACVAETRERTVEEYALSRLARLYSVILPAFILTAVLDNIAMAIDPQLYEPGYLAQMGHGPVDGLLGYALSAVFLSQSWTLKMSPGSNLPFWSLNREVWYYVLFRLSARAAKVGVD